MTTHVGRPAGAARERLLSVALDLFAVHGVSGTSLQMIADVLGVTKAAVYHQFQSKEEIVLAVVAPAVDSVARIADLAEARRSPASRREAALSGLVDLVVKNRRLAAVLRADPTVGQLIREYPDMVELSRRIGRLLTGPDPAPEIVVGAAMVGGGLMIAGMDPTLAEFDDEALRRHLLSGARRLLRVRTPGVGQQT